MMATCHRFRRSVKTKTQSITMKHTILAFLILLLTSLSGLSYSTGYAIKGWYREVIDTPATGKVTIEHTLDWDKLYEVITSTTWTAPGAPSTTVEEHFWSNRLNPSQFRTKWRITRVYSNHPSTGSVVTLGGDTPLRVGGFTPRIGSWQGQAVNAQGNAYIRTVGGDFNMLIRPGPLELPPIATQDSYALIYFRVMDQNTLAWHYFATGYRVPSHLTLIIYPDATQAWPALGTPESDGSAYNWAPGGILWTMGTYYGWWGSYPGNASHAIYKDQSDPQVSIIPIPTYYRALKDIGKDYPIVIHNPEWLQTIENPWSTTEQGFPGDPEYPLLPEVWFLFP